METREPIRQECGADSALADPIEANPPEAVRKERREERGEMNTAGGTALSDEELGEVVGGFYFFFF